MLNPTTKAKLLTLSTLSASIRNLVGTPFQFDRYALGLPFAAAQAQYGVSQREYNHLFVPGGQSLDGLGGYELETNARPGRVADNIDAFVAMIKMRY